MKKWLNDIKKFLHNRVYLLALSLTAVCSYGFLVTHATVGIDDTPYIYYFEDGLVAIVGRWVLYLLNKVVHIADFAPFVTDFAGVLLLMAAVTVWCVLFYSILGERIPRYGYLFFAAIFLSCPLISEVYTYYLHNGISIGYLSCGISLCCFQEGRERLGQRNTWRWILPFLGAAVGLWIAIGCYESLMIVWLVGVCLALLTERFAGKKSKVFRGLLAAAIVAVVGIVLRSVMIATVTQVFGLGEIKGDAVQRSITEMASWILAEGAKAEFAMVLKRMIVMYGAFAYAYYPIKIFVFASFLLICFGIWRSIRQRDPWILILTLGSFVASFLLIFIEGRATLYRAAQFLPVLCGYGALILVYAVNNLATRLAVIGGDRGKMGGRMTWLSRRMAGLVRVMTVLGLSVIVWDQCTDMNRWFYVDYLKYEDAKNTAAQIYYELEKDFDTEKPVVFTGTYEIPRGLIEAAYVPYGSETFFRINNITSRIDEHLLEKFYRPYGVWVAQTPSLSVIDWGRYAFDDDTELVRFFAMHGHELVPLLGVDYAAAENLSVDWPHFPARGSIADVGDYIIVHF